MNWWFFPLSDWSSEKIRAREKCARKILLVNAKVQDAKLESLLQRAFDEGMQLFEFEGNFFLRFNPATRHFMKAFNAPLDNVVAFTDDVDYTEKVTSILACIIPDDESVTFVDIAKTVEVIGQYRRKLLLPEIKALMFEH